MATETSTYYWNTNIYIPISILTKFCSRGKDFQSADSVGVIATAIWDTVFPVLQWGTKTTNNFTFKY